MPLPGLLIGAQVVSTALWGETTKVTNPLEFVTFTFAVRRLQFVEPLTVGEGGLEPPRPEGHWHLKPARLPFRHSPGKTTDGPYHSNGHIPQPPRRA